MSKLLKLGNSIFFLFGSLWLYFSVYFLFQYLNIDYTNLTNGRASLLIGIALGIFLLFHFKEKAGLWGSKSASWLNRHKGIVFFVMLGFQLFVTLTSVRLASSDSTIVYMMATNKEFALTNDYISINPNNFLLVIWMKINHLIFGTNTILALALWNIFFLDASICFLYQTNKAFLKKGIADISFFLLVHILGFSSQYIYIYSDPIALFFLSLSLYLFGFAIKKNLDWKFFLGSGFVFSIANGFRPTVLIFAIAGLIVMANHLFFKKRAMNLKKLLQSSIVFLLAFFSLTFLQDYTLNHQNIVKYEENKSRTLLYYIDLGLTYTGNNHAEIPEEVRLAEGKDRSKSALRDISKRLKDYQYSSFVGHVFYKYYWMTGEGMFGWYQERILREDSHLDSPWLKWFQGWNISKYVRSFIYVEGQHYFYYASLIQIFWILISLGIFVYPFYYREKNYQLWMQIGVFGALLFLLIFEAGRSRYLIQFLPAILTVSACGLYGLWTSLHTLTKGVVNDDTKTIHNRTLLQ